MEINWKQQRRQQLPKCVSGSRAEINSAHEPLIPGLPDDITIECLLKIPVTSHRTLRLVSRTWNSLVSDPEFYSHRRRLGTAERLLFLLSPPPQQPPPIGKSSPDTPEYSLSIFNLSRCEWRRLSIPIPSFAQCVAVRKLRKVVVLGGWDPVTLEPVSRVLVLDLAKGTWKEGSPMPTARSFFACAAVGESSIYVAGGHDGGKNALRSAAAYDVVSDTWRVLPDMSEERDESHGLCFNSSKFCVVSGYGTENQGLFRPDCEIFDPETESWTRIESVWPYPNSTPRTSACGGGQGRWMFIGEGEVREFDWEAKMWNTVDTGRVPKNISGSSSSMLVNMGQEKIFVMGNGGDICEGEGAYILETSNGKGHNWNHVHTSCGFLGFPFSASHLLI